MHEDKALQDPTSPHASWILAQLEQAYGRPQLTSRRDPLDELVLTILSQHTSDKNSERAFDSLKSRFPSWVDVTNAPHAQIVEAIRSGGLANRKAAIISRALDMVMERGIMDSLDSVPIHEAIAELTSVPGIGPKTAACVMLFGFGRPALPVDTHVYRVASRIGLVSSGVSNETAQRRLESLLKPDDIYSFHMNMIRHGRQTCVARTPRCNHCIVSAKCMYYQRRQTDH